ncbi:MAG: hypothetical protein WCR85_00075 [Sphaerochaeta sp.]
MEAPKDSVSPRPITDFAMKCVEAGSAIVFLPVEFTKDSVIDSFMHLIALQSRIREEVGVEPFLIPADMNFIEIAVSTLGSKVDLTEDGWIATFHPEAVKLATDKIMEPPTMPKATNIGSGEFRICFCPEGDCDEYGGDAHCPDALVCSLASNMSVQNMIKAVYRAGFRAGVCESYRTKKGQQ